MRLTFTIYVPLLYFLSVSVFSDSPLVPPGFQPISSVRGWVSFYLWPSRSWIPIVENQKHPYASRNIFLLYHIGIYSY